MQLTQTVSMAFKAISGNKVRAFLTMLGVIIGVMSAIVLIAIGQGTTASVTESISSMGTNLLTVSIQTRRVAWACRADSADLAAAVPPRARSF
ncbi:MAG: ABC transporter permease [Christensenellales bacterium]